jgi:uncharacterized protein YciI
MSDASPRKSIHERLPNTCCMVICRDVADSGPLRDAVMGDHMAYIETILDRLKLAGPLFDAQGMDPQGSYYCVATQDPREALAIVHNDPLYKAGVFASVQVHTTMLAAGSLVGGKVW